jgi:hypothetical protein
MPWRFDFFINAGRPLNLKRSRKLGKVKPQSTGGFAFTIDDASGMVSNPSAEGRSVTFVKAAGSNSIFSLRLFRKQLYRGWRLIAPLQRRYRSRT